MGHGRGVFAVARKKRGVLRMGEVYAVIMAGGRGERFWPLSTDRAPKPFVRLLGEKTLLQQAVARLQPLVPRERILISIGEAQRHIAAQQLPESPPDSFIVEPVGRDTAACLGYCALHLEARSPDSIMLALPADHFVADGEAYLRAIEAGIRSLPGAAAIIFGIRPDRPETGYGYVQATKPAMRAESWPVVRFVEKPDLATASEYLRSGDYFWNSGIFLWRNSALLGLIEEHMPETYRGLCGLRPLLRRPDAGDERLRIFASLPRISIDYGVLEKATGLRLVPAGFNWDDIGNWAALERALPSDPGGNVNAGPCRMLDATGCITYTDAGAVAAFGVSNLVIVQARGRVLVCSKESAPDLKRLVSALAPDQK
jgi:mannose-1-phosphate guanylyltransferase